MRPRRHGQGREERPPPRETTAGGSGAGPTPGAPQIPSVGEQPPARRCPSYLRPRRKRPHRRPPLAPPPPDTAQAHSEHPPPPPPSGQRGLPGSRPRAGGPRSMPGAVVPGEPRGTPGCAVRRPRRGIAARRRCPGETGRPGGVAVCPARLPPRSAAVQYLGNGIARRAPRGLSCRGSVHFPRAHGSLGAGPAGELDGVA